MKIPVEQQDAIYSNLWKPMQDKLETLEDMTEFIRHFLMKDGNFVKKNEVYYTLIQRIGNQNVLQYLTELRNFSDFYSKLITPVQEPNKEISDRLKTLNRIEVTTAYPFLLSIYYDYSQHKIDDWQFVQILDIIENFMIRRFICKVPTNFLNSIFPSLYKQSTSGIFSDIISGLKHTLSSKGYPRDPEFQDRFIFGKLYTHGDNIDKAKLILERLEESFKHHESIDFTNASIEHIMPQVLTEWWKNELGENFEEDYDEWLHTVGNLTLTGYNSNMLNYDFPRKKLVLTASHLELNRYFDNLDKWNEEDIHKRGDLLAEKALGIWAYFGPRQVKEEIPKELVFMDIRYEVSSWRDEQKLLESIYQYDNELFEQIINKYQHYVNKTNASFITSRQLSNSYWMETNLSAERIHKFCINATELIWLSSEDWQLKY